MKKTLRWLCVLCALCMLSGAALADCGIGDAAVYAPVAAAPVVNMPSEGVMGAVQVQPDAGVAAATSAYGDGSGVEGFVYRMYTIALGREPDPYGFEGWVLLLESGQAKAVDLVKGFLGSDEYKGLNKSNEQVVADCYNIMLNRDPDPAGFANWVSHLNVGMTFESVCAGFIDSQEFLMLAAQYGIAPGTLVLTNARDQNYERTAFVYRLYENCLGRDPDLPGLENWCFQLGRGVGGTRVASGFVFSPEYKNQLNDNESYVDMLYRTILGREGEAAGMANWTSLLDYTYTREKLLNGFMNSAEFANKCAVAGIKVGEKINEPDDTHAWKANVLILSAVNAERAKVGLAPLKTREDLWERVAMVRAREVAKKHEHTRPNGSICWTAYTEAGFIPGVYYSYAGENIAWGYDKEAAVMKAWMASPDHRENILRSNFTTLATGLYGSNWSQNFMEEIY